LLRVGQLFVFCFYHKNVNPTKATKQSVASGLGKTMTKN